MGKKNQKNTKWKAPVGYLTREQTMERLGVSSSTLHRIVQEGNFTNDGESIYYHRKRCYLEKAVLQYLKKEIEACYSH